MDDLERTLILRARDHDVDAFSEWIQTHWVRLVGFARSTVGDSDAEDIVQDSLVIAWAKIGSLRAPEAFRVALRIDRSKCFDSFTRAIRGHRLPAKRIGSPWTWPQLYQFSLNLQSTRPIS